MAQDEQMLLSTVRAALRITHTALDQSEIVPLIEAAKMELRIAGVVTVCEDDPLIIRAVTAYAKAHFGYDNPDKAFFEKQFESLKNKLSMCGEYVGGGTSG